MVVSGDLLVIRHVALSSLFLSLFPAFFQVPESENPVQLVSVSQRYDDHADPDPDENPKSDILMMSKVTASQGEQDGPKEPSCASNNEKLRRAQVPQSKNVTEPILGKAGDQEKKKDKEGCFVVQEIVKSLHGGLGDEPLYERTAEGSSEDKRDVGTDGEPDGREHDTEKLAEQVPSQEPRHFTGDRSGHHLSDLHDDKDKHRPRAEGVQKVCHSLFVQEKLDDTGLVKDDRETPDDHDENQKPEPDVGCFGLLRLLRIDLVIRRIVPLQLSVSQLAAVLQIQ